MSSLPLRIAILACDTPLPRTKAKYGTYGGVFTSLLKSGADRLAYPGLSSTEGLQLRTYDVVEMQEYPSLDEIEGVLLTGSKFNSFDNDPWIVKLVEFVKTVLAQRRVRIVGVCFGHQIVGRALGAEVKRNEEGWEVSVTDIELTGKGKQIFGKETLAIQQMHQDIVATYPPEVEPLGRSDTCAVQGMYIPKCLITVQGHPEFTKDIVSEILVSRHEAGIFDDGMFEDAMKRVGNRQDGVDIAAAFLKFLLE